MNSTMFNAGDILETIRMIQDECLDIRTTTMGISLLDCIDPDINKACDKVYDKITRKAEKLVETGEKIEKEYGIPIINKRISVTPIAMLAAACPKDNPVKFAKALQRAAETCGVNFVGGYSALVHIASRSPKLEKAQQWVNRFDTSSLFMLSLLPFTPTSFMHFAFGMSDFDEKRYLRAVLLGKGLMVAMMAVFGQSLVSSLKNPVYLVLAVLLWGGMYWVSKRFCRKHHLE